MLSLPATVILQGFKGFFSPNGHIAFYRPAISLSKSRKRQDHNQCSQICHLTDSLFIKQLRMAEENMRTETNCLPFKVFILKALNKFLKLRIQLNKMCSSVLQSEQNDNYKAWVKGG